jgi:hypothetical protein
MRVDLEKNIGTSDSKISSSPLKMDRFEVYDRIVKWPYIAIEQSLHTQPSGQRVQDQRLFRRQPSLSKEQAGHKR